MHSVASMEQLRHGVGSRSAHRKRGVHAGDGALIALEKGTLVVCAEMWRPGGKERLVAAVCLRVHPCGLRVCSVASCLVVRDGW